jgi:putative FmdB family regulatory protein
VPLYLYRCRNKKCKHEQEAIRPISKVYNRLSCEKCGSDTENIIATPARMVRGQGGWSSPAPKG